MRRFRCQGGAAGARRLARLTLIAAILVAVAGPVAGPAAGQPVVSMAPAIAGVASTGVASTGVASLVPAETTQPEQETGPSVPVAAPTANGGLALFIRRADGMLWRRDRDPAGHWGIWVDTGRSAKGKPELGRNLNGGLMVFVRGDDDQLWRQVQQPNGSWQGWQAMGTPSGAVLDSDPAVAVNDDRAATAVREGRQGDIGGNESSRNEVFIRDTEGRLWHRAQRASDGSNWTDWRRLGQDFQGRFTGNPVAVVGGDGRIVLFSRDGGGYVRQSAQVNPGRPGLAGEPHAQWSSWERITGNRNVRPGEDISVVVNTIGRFGTLLQVFANNGNGYLWTITQAEAGSTANPNGSWAAPENLRNAYVSSPVAVAGADGRLHVFGLRPNDRRIAYRSQVSTVAPADPANPGLVPDPNGNWYACCTAWDGGPRVRTMNVVDTGEGKLEVFAIREGDNSVVHRRQLSAGRPQAPTGTWHRWNDLNPIGQPCVNGGSMNCVFLWNERYDTFLDGAPRANNRVWNVSRETGTQNTKAWRMRLTAGEGLFQLANMGTGRCLQDLDSGYLETRACDAQQPRQHWYLRPVAPGAAGSDPSQYEIVSRHGSGRCVIATTWHQGEVWSDRCHDSNGDNRFTFRGLTANNTDALDLALSYAAARCGDNDPAVTCRWVEDGSLTQPAYRTSAGCVSSQVVYNSDHNESARLRVVRYQMTGVETSVGATLSGNLFGLGAEVSASTGWVAQQTDGTEYEFSVPPRHFGWAVQASVERESVGIWDFTVDGRTWTSPGKVLAYAQDGTDGVSQGVLSNVTSTAPPTVGRC